MKRLIIYALITAPYLASGQEPSLKPLPEFTYITPEMTKQQVDSLIIALEPYGLTLGFDTLIYGENKMIKQVNGSLYGKNEYFLMSSPNFGGITIINRNGIISVVMGLFYPPPEKSNTSGR